ncbi:serine kinase [Metabacillus schmidteae]|nr:serine kinase [Metabacillus schmidteae]
MFLGILLILFGAFLLGLTIDQFGDLGNIIMNIIGIGCLLVGALLGKKKN